MVALALLWVLKPVVGVGAGSAARRHERGRGSRPRVVPTCIRPGPATHAFASARLALVPACGETA